MVKIKRNFYPTSLNEHIRKELKPLEEMRNKLYNLAIDKQARALFSNMLVKMPVPRKYWRGWRQLQNFAWDNNFKRWVLLV